MSILGSCKNVCFLGYSMYMDVPVVAEAQKYLDKLDFIVDLFDNGFVWASDEILTLGGYTFEEFTKHRLFDTLDPSVDQDGVRKRLSEDLSKQHGIIKILVNTKAGKKVNLEMEFHVFKYNHIWYMVGKLLKSEPLP
jgi:hypothetical protein